MVPDSTIADQLAQGVAIYEAIDDDNDFLLRYLNPAGAAMTHCDAEAVRGRRLSDLFPGAQGLGMIDALRRTRRTGQSLHLKTNLYSDAALKLWVENRLSRLDSGLVMAVFEDRSELVQLRQVSADTEARYRRLFENSLVGIFTVSKDRYITDMNQRACEIFGFRYPEDAVDRSIELVHIDRESYQRFGQEVFARIAGDGILQLEYQLKRRNGETFWAELSGKPINGRDREEGVIWIINDIADAKAAREALRESEERFKLAVAGANDGLWDWKIPTDEIYFSPRWKALLGYADDEIPNRFDEWHRRLHPDDRPAVEAAIDAHLHGETPQLSSEFRMRCKDGSWRWILARAQCVRDADGRPLRMAGSHTDIDDRKRAEQAIDDSRRRLAAVFETVQTGIVLIDLDAKQVVQANTPATTMLGLGRGELIGQPCWERLCSTPQSCPFAEDLKPIINREALFTHSDGRRFPVLKSVVPLDHGEQRLVLESFVDISRQKEDERALMEARDAAQQAARAKSEFLAKMSHEILTPMNSIISMTRFTLETELTDEQRENLEIVEISAAALLQLIKDIFDFSRIESGRLELAPTDFALEPLLADVVESFGLRPAEKGIALTTLAGNAVPEHVRADRASLRKVLVNLVGNAVKFTDRGEVQVRVDAEPGTDGGQAQLRFQVTDTGIGVPPAQVERIFQAFHQGDNSDARRYGGTGLGLSICRQLIEAMDGEIGLEDRPEGGSRFWFRIPLKSVDQAPSPAPPAAAEALLTAPGQTEALGRGQPPPMTPLSTLEADPLAGLRVLLVEDKPFNQVVAERHLIGRHIRVDIANNGAEGVAAIERGRFDLVLMDVQMPIMDGYEATRRIRTLEAAADPPRHTPIIAMTAHVMPEDRERCLAAGMDDYVSKPIHRDGLFTTIARWAGVEDAALPPLPVPLPAASADVEATAAAAPPDDSPQRAVTAALERLRDLFGDDETLPEIIEIFLEDAPKSMDMLTTAVQGGDAEAIAIAAHGLKGMLRNFGLDALGDLFQRLEQRARAGETAAAASLLADAEQGLGAIYPLLQDHRSEPSA